MVDLLQDFITEAQAVEGPVIGELLGLIEVFVKGFEDAEGDLVHALVEAHVGAINEAVGVLGIELGGEAGDGGGLGVASRDVGVEVGIAFEDFAEVIEIVIQVGEVAGDERGGAVRSRMSTMPGSFTMLGWLSRRHSKAFMRPSLCLSMGWYIQMGSAT